MTNPIPATTGSAKALASIETSPGVWNLLIGSVNNTQPILYRNSTVFIDNGTAYEANAVIGSVVLAMPGELAELGFITGDFIRTGTSPGMYVLVDEIDGTLSNYANLSGSVVSDPPLLYGVADHPNTLYSNRYYFKQTDESTSNPAGPAYCRNMCILINFGTDSVQNEALSITIYGAIMVENG